LPDSTDINVAQTDLEWADKIAGGDEQAFKLLYDRHAPGIYRLCLRFLNNSSEAEDAVQDIFIKIHRSINRYHGQARLSTWLFRLAVNHCLNQQRNLNKIRWLSLDFSGKRELVSLEHEHNPQQRLEQSETEKIVQQAIRALPARQRLALILCRYELKSYQEIAQVMECSVSAVESCLHHAKKNLAISLKKILDQ
jgi:RNA polymerase sigma-70 factor, ECF subfamily